MEFIYCKNIFSNKHILNSHQKKTRYCLKLQGKEEKEIFAANTAINHLQLNMFIIGILKLIKII